LQHWPRQEVEIRDAFSTLTGSSDISRNGPKLKSQSQMPPHASSANQPHMKSSNIPLTVKHDWYKALD